ncbi:hypothetical protein VB773_03500 [Haloarculaceae archaeon H-GB2-1]|nr:hypothetical protein [Haloarculaceae archaeon H-GB1-1]MEA5388680.1 hypothetical protein [Haloarculaceae archaeon H-GB11]MEA5406736.1 hypothetical protein [Haloarculaceae archaeon H-GB2-1]
MRRTTTLVLVTMLILGSFSLSVTGAAQTTTADATTTASENATTATANGTTAVTNSDGNDTDATVTDENASDAPGAALGGVVGMQRASLEGEVEARTFGLAVARAASENGRVAVVAEQYGDLDARLANLTERKRALQRAHANGSISTAQFRAEMAVLHERTKAVRRLSNETANASAELPAEKLEARGVNATAIQRLQRNASNLTGPEVAAIARNIGGRNHGRAQGLPPGLSGTQGPPANVSQGPSANVSQGQPENGSQGPPELNATEGGLGNATQDQLANATTQTSGQLGNVTDDDTSERGSSGNGGSSNAGGQGNGK